MKMITGLTALLFIVSAGARADALLTCKDSTGHEIFQGYIGTDMSPISEKITRETEINFNFAVPAKPAMGLDRATFTRMTGINLKKCEGPYAHIYEKQPTGKMRCAAGKVKALDGENAGHEEVLSAIGLPKGEAACSVILPKEKMLGLPH